MCSSDLALEGTIEDLEKYYKKAEAATSDAERREISNDLQVKMSIFLEQIHKFIDFQSPEFSDVDPKDEIRPMLLPQLLSNLLAVVSVGFFSIYVLRFSNIFIGKMLGVMSKTEALEKAREADKDLVLINEKAQPVIVKIIDLAKFTNIFSAMIGTTSSFLMGVFIILFLTFYTMLEPYLLKNFILNLTPAKYENDLSNVLMDSRRLLTRYTYGIFTEVAIMMTLEVIGLSIFGIPNALLIGFLGGLMNIIPYLGPLIGATAGILLAVLSQLAMGSYDSITGTILIVLGVFGVANMIDNLVLQPQIYSKSVKAHPVEVFLIIIIGGKLAGITGMILAIPFYTIVKVVARQFMNHMRVVKFLTQRM